MVEAGTVDSAAELASGTSSADSEAGPVELACLLKLAQVTQFDLQRSRRRPRSRKERSQSLG